MKRWILVLGWAAVIFLTSSTVVTTRQLAGVVTSVSSTPSGEFELLWRTVWWIPVKGWHVTEFALLFTLAYWAIPRKAHAALVCLAYAVFDELHQAYVASRGGRLSDVLIDTLGIVLAWCILANLEKPKARRAPAWAWFAGLAAGMVLVFVLAHFPFGDLPKIHL